MTDKIVNISKEYVERMKDLDVLIIGETIIDEYQYGQTLGKAGKFPIVAFQNERIERYSGGVSAIRYHLEDFCNVDKSTDCMAIVKKRYVQNGQKLFETYDVEETEYGYARDNYGDYDIVIVADFGHGFITDKMRNSIEQEANYIALNTQFNAGNMGMNTINKYESADYVCIDENELRLAMSNQYDDIEDIIMKKFHYPQVASITISNRGTMVFKGENITHIKAFADKPIDTVGAGDAYLAISSLLAYLDAPSDIIGFVGNCAGSIACSYPGNKEYLTKKKLYKSIDDNHDKI